MTKYYCIYLLWEFSSLKFQHFSFYQSDLLSCTLPPLHLFICFYIFSDHQVTKMVSVMLQHSDQAGLPAAGGVGPLTS